MTGNYGTLSRPETTVLSARSMKPMPICYFHTACVLRLTGRSSGILYKSFSSNYKNRKNLSTTDHIKFYLFCAFRHQLQNELAKVIPSVDITECETTFTLDQSALDQLIYDEKELNRQKKLNQLLNDLPVRQKMVIQYRFIEGLKYEEIAQLMDMNYQSVHNLLQRALNKIREEWQDDKSLLLTFFLIRRMQEGR